VTDPRFSFYRSRIRVHPGAAGTTPATDAGLPGLNAGSASTTGLPAFYINGNGGFNFGYGLSAAFPPIAMMCGPTTVLPPGTVLKP
jgi:hypothetical protein